MSDSVTVTIKGLAELEERLINMGPKLARRAVRKALTAGADVIKDAAKANAPILSQQEADRQPGELRDSIDTQLRLSGTNEVGTAKVGPLRDKSKGQQDPGYFGQFVEFGSEHGPAQPYLRPAYDNESDAALEAIVAALTAELSAV